MSDHIEQGAAASWAYRQAGNHQMADAVLEHTLHKTNQQVDAQRAGQGQPGQQQR